MQFKKIKKSFGYLRMKLERRSRHDRFFILFELLFQRIENIYWRIKAYTVIEIIGDSHCKVFRRLNYCYPEANYRFRPHSVMGATLAGLDNYDSVSGARKKFNKTLNSKPHNNLVAVMLGEIDINYNIWFRAARNSSHYLEELDYCFKKYEAFLMECELFTSRLIVFSAPLPIVRDGASIGERQKIDVSINERMKLAELYSKKLHVLCKKNGYLYINLDEASIDQSTGFVKDSLIGETVTNHHYSEPEYTSMLKNALNALGKRFYE